MSAAGDQGGPGSHEAPPPQRGFLASGGWMLLAGLALTTVVFAVHVATLLSPRGHAIGDGHDVATYGFVLTPARVSAGDIVASGMPRDGLPALVDPGALPASAARKGLGGSRTKYVLPGDRVVGVELGGEARAYPLRVLAWHEVANDTLGGHPIAVTYNPLCDSAAVFSRRVGAETLELGVSGLLLDSNLLMYDRRSDGRPASLWSQLLLAAITGPAAGRGERLELLPAEVTSWQAWRDAHPGTTVLAPDPQLAERYSSDPYSSYFGNDELRFPVHPLPPAGNLARKTPVIAVALGEAWAAFPYPVVASHAGPGGSWAITVDGQALVLHAAGDPLEVQATGPDGVLLPAVHAFYFAWYALHRDDTRWVME